MASPLYRSIQIALRVVVAGACWLGIWNSWKLARADWLFQQDTEGSVRAAIRLAPDGWMYYMRLAQFDRGQARNLLANSLRLNRFDAQADIELGLQYEAEGEYPMAEKLLLAAFEVDHTYLPRWSLTNYYFRRDNIPAFWEWARSSAEMPAEDVGPLFELCWRISPDPERISAAILNEKPELIRQYLAFLLGKNQLASVAVIAPRLIRAGVPDSDRPLLFSVVNRLIAAKDAVAANGLWHLLINRQWVVADATLPNNPDFVRAPLPVSFDWSLPEYPGMHSWPGSSGLEVEFTGSQPEECTIAEQAITLAPGHYTLAYSYRTTDIPPDTGIRWQIIDVNLDRILADSSDLSSAPLTKSALSFSVPPGASLLRLRLTYRRSIGTPRISGMLDVLSTQIQATPQP